ncbi:unnamed protein product, partial [Laminaria digitata]
MSKTATLPEGPTPAPTTPLEEGDPWGGVPAIVPGLVQAEEFDTGGEGVGF